MYPPVIMPGTKNATNIKFHVSKKTNTSKPTEQVPVHMLKRRHRKPEIFNKTEKCNGDNQELNSE